MGPSFDKNPRNGGSQRCHKIENLSVKTVIKTLDYDYKMQ